MISPVCAPEGYPKKWRSSWLFEATALLLGISLPVSNVLMNVCLALVLLCLLIQRDIQAIFFILIKQPVIWLPLLMFALLALSLFIHPHAYGPEMVGKYKKLLYVLPLALFFRRQPLLVRRFVSGFLLANAVILLFSSGVGLLHLPLGHIDPLNPTVFKLHITQNFFMALAALIWLSLAFAHSGITRIGYGLLTLLACYDVLFLVLGRTGYVALIVGFGIWGLLSLSFRQRLVLLVMSVVALSTLTAVPNRAYQRMSLGVTEIHNCLKNVDGDNYASCATSMGQRTGFALTSLKLIKQAPLFGNGAGSFWYDDDETGYSINNPHNQYLLETVQSGGVGLVLFLSWMLSCYKIAWRYTPAIRNVFIALISGYMACHLFNSFLLDSAEGHLFVILAAILINDSFAKSANQPELNT